MHNVWCFINGLNKPVLTNPVSNPYLVTRQNGFTFKKAFYEKVVSVKLLNSLLSKGFYEQNDIRKHIFISLSTLYL